MFPSRSPESQPPQTRALLRATVNNIKEVAPDHYQIQLRCPPLARSAQPGQFVHILTTPNPAEWVFDPLLRRAFSIMSVDSITNESIEILFRVEGRGTQALARARIGDGIDLLGPLGKPFDLSPFAIPVPSDDMFHVKQSQPDAIVVGGGVGVPPLVFLGQVLHSSGIAVHPLIGARSAKDIIGYEELSAICERVGVATDDGSQGHHGKVTDLLSSLFHELIVEEKTIKPIVYSCGPLPMLRAIAQMCATAGVRCQVSLEENMPCGIGVCNGCVVRTSQPFTDSPNEQNRDLNQVVGNEWSPYRAYRRVCVEGPACWADEIDWHHQG